MRKSVILWFLLVPLLAYTGAYAVGSGAATEGALSGVSGHELYRPVVRSSNPNISVRFAPSLVPSLNSCPVGYVIITSDELAPSFQPLAGWKTRKGVPAVVRTVSWIRGRYDGQDDQERIRNFIRDAHANWGTEWVVLGGDESIVPSRKAIPLAQGSPPTEVMTDLYYSCLEGNWNGNGNAYFGEVDDNPDLSPEVFVGRVPLASATEVSAYVTKLIQYEALPINTAGAPNYDAMLFMGALLSGEDSRALCDSIANYHIPPFYHKGKLYESSGNLLRQNVIDSLNRGPGLVYSQTHGGLDYLKLMSGERLTTGDISGLTNHFNQSVWYCLTCRANSYQYDCLSKQFLQNSSGGGVAFIGSTYEDYPFESFGMDMKFFDLLFGGCSSIGEALALAKEQQLTETRPTSPSRLTSFARVLLGDPEMPVWTANPAGISVSYPATVPLGPSPFQVTVTQNTPIWPPPPVPGALVCVMKNSEFYASGVTNANGVVTFNLCAEAPGPMSVVVTKHNYQTYDGVCNAVVQSTLPYVCVAGKLVFDPTGNNNGIPEAGEAVGLQVSLKNTAMAPALNVWAQLFSADQYVTVTSGMSMYGNIWPMQPAQGTPPFGLAINPSCPDNHDASFNMVIHVANPGVPPFTDTLLITIHAPNLVHFRHVVDDDSIPPSAGNGNHIAEAGESVELPLTMRNDGFGQADQVVAFLDCADTNVSIVNNIEHFPALPPRAESPDVSSHFLFSLRPGWTGAVPFVLTIHDLYAHTWRDSFFLHSPAIPENVVAIPGRDYMDLVWKPVSRTSEPALLGYNVYRRGDTTQPWCRVNAVPISDGALYRDVGLARATPYQYAVTALDSSRNDGPRSQPASNQTNPMDHPGWPQVMNDGAFASVVAYDFCPGYAGLEVLAATYNGTIYMWHHDGTGVLNTSGVFTVTDLSIYASPAVADINDDGLPEIVVLLTDFANWRSVVNVWNAGASLLWSDTIPNPNWSASTPVIGQVREPHTTFLDIIVATQPGHVYLYDAFGHRTLFASVSGDGFGTSSPALGDINFDGHNEVLIGGGKAVYAWRYNGQTYDSLYGWPQLTTGAYFTSVVIGDILPDRPGLEFAACAYKLNKLYVGCADGSVAPGWPQPVTTFQCDYFTSPSLFRFSSSSSPQIALPGNNRVYLFDNAGNLRAGFPVVRRVYSSSSVTSGDITGDGVPEVIVGSGLDDNCLYAADSLGKYVSGFPVSAGMTVASTATLGDIDSDGNTEILVASDDGNVYVFDLPALWNSANGQWPMFRHDLRRTGNFGVSQDFSLAGSAPSGQAGLRTIFCPVQPNPFRGTATLSYSLAAKFRVALQVFDPTGREVRMLLNAEQNAGNYTLRWDGRDEHGALAPEGIYFCRMSVPETGFTASRKLMLTR